MKSCWVDPMTGSLHRAPIETNPKGDVNHATDTFLGKQLNRGIVQSRRIGAI